MRGNAANSLTKLFHIKIKPLKQGEVFLAVIIFMDWFTVQTQKLSHQHG